MSSLTPWAATAVPPGPSRAPSASSTARVVRSSGPIHTAEPAAGPGSGPPGGGAGDGQAGQG